MEPALRESVWRRADATCEYCRIPQQFNETPFEIDHIIAQKHGGVTDERNLALSCYFCNAYKGPNVAGIDPESGEVIRLFHPRQDDWSEHFQWQGADLIGRTPEGRATIAALRINLPERRMLRVALIAEGQFPP